MISGWTSAYSVIVLLMGPGLQGHPTPALVLGDEHLAGSYLRQHDT